MNLVVLDADTLGNDISLAAFSAYGTCTVYPTTPTELVKERICQAEVAILNKVKLTAEVLAAAKRLKLICVAATGYDNIDTAYCKSHGIAVCNVVGYSSHSVAQVTAAMVLSLSVHLSSYTSYVSSGAYSQNGVANRVTPVYHELFDKTWGIIGYGNIGKEVAGIAKALGCKLLVYKRTPSAELPCVDLDTLCKNADIITIHTPLNAQTKELINKDRLALMKRDVILVNAARGGVTDEKAICDAIKAGTIGAFGTDVYVTEPFAKEHPFDEIKGYPNVALTPHMAWGAYEARCRCIDEIDQNIKAFLCGEIRNRVDLL